MTKIKSVTIMNLATPKARAKHELLFKNCRLKIFPFWMLCKWLAEKIHRYLKKNRLLKFCYVPATSAASSKGIFVEVTNSTNQTNKAGSMWHYPSFTRKAKIGPIFAVRPILPGSPTDFWDRNFPISPSDFVQFMSDCVSKISNEIQYKYMD